MITPTVELIFPDNPKRSLIDVRELPEDFLPDVLVVDGDKLEIKVVNLGVDLGAVGDVLEGEGVIQELAVPEADGVWDVASANLTATIISEEQQSKLGIDIEAGTRVGVIENKDKDKRVFFRLPDLDVAEKFAKKIENVGEYDQIIKRIGEVDSVFPTEADKFLEASRLIYGVWNFALKNNKLEVVDEAMSMVYKGILPEEGMTIEAITDNLKVFLKEEESNPAENWWRARAATNKIIDILDKDGGLDKSFQEVLKVIDLVAEKQFSPGMLWKFIVQPIMDEFCSSKRGGDRYEQTAFLARLLGDQEYTVAGFKLKQVKEVKEILGE